MSDNTPQFIKYGIQVKANGAPQQKVRCPKCSDERRDKKDKSLSVNLGLGVFRCHYCGWEGCVVPDEDHKNYVQPDPYEKSKLSQKTNEYFRKRGISNTTIVARKISEETVWMPKEDGLTDVIVFNYFQNGRLVNKKYRSEDKGFKMVSGAKLIFYGIDTTVGKDYVIITEGEFDSLSFFEAGFNSVVSVPNGANKGQQKLDYLDNCIDYFLDKKRIYLAVDNDDAGESLFQELSRRLGRDRCYRVHYQQGCKDANDVLVSHGIDGVKSLVSEASPLPLEGILDIKEERQSIIDLYNNGVERGEELEDLGGKFDEICTFQRGKLYVISGIPSHGKSVFLENIATVLAAKKGWKFGVFSPEHYPVKYLIHRLAELLIGRPFFEGGSERMSVHQLEKAVDFIEEHFFFIRPNDEMYTLDNILSIGRSLVERHGIDGFIIDPWNTIAHDFSGKSETQYIEEALNRITLWKQQNDVAFFLVAHPKKMQKIQSGENAGQYEVPSLYDIAGSANFFNKADMGICIYRNFNENLTYFYMQKVKYRNLGENGLAKFKFNRLNNRFEWADENKNGETMEDGTLLPIILKPRFMNLLKKDGVQGELDIEDSVKKIQPNKEFDDLPF